MDIEPTSPDPAIPTPEPSVPPAPSDDPNRPDPPASQETPPILNDLLLLLKKPPQRQSAGFYNLFTVREWSKAVELQIVSCKHVATTSIRANRL